MSRLVFPYKVNILYEAYSQQHIQTKWRPRDISSVLDHLASSRESFLARMVKIMTSVSASEALTDLHGNHFFIRQAFTRNLFVFKCFNNLIEYNFNVLSGKNMHKYKTNYAHNLQKPSYKLNWRKQRSAILFIDEWNKISDNIKYLNSLLDSKSSLKKYLSL